MSPSPPAPFCSPFPAALPPSPAAWEPPRDVSPSPAPRQHHLSRQGQTPLPQERGGRSPAPQTLQGANGSSGCLENSGKICLCHGSEPFLWLLLQNKQWVFKNTSLYIEAGWIREDPFWGRAGVREEGAEQILAPGAPASLGAWREGTDRAGLRQQPRGSASARELEG